MGRGNLRVAADLAAAAMLSTAFWFGLAVDAQAQTPRSLKIVVPYTPASGPDILSRLMAEQFSKQHQFHERHVLEDPGTPNHVVEMQRITSARARGELEWTKEFRDRVRGGEYSFAGEPPDWTPPAGMVTHWNT